MTKDQLSEIRERVEKASPGPWSASGYRVDEAAINCGWRISSEESRDVSQPQAAANTQFVAHARSDIPSLLAHVDQQQAEIEKLNRDLRASENQKEIYRQETHRWSANEKKDKATIETQCAEITRLKAALEVAESALDEIRNQAIICKDGEMCALSESGIIAITTKALAQIKEVK